MFESPSGSGTICKNHSDFLKNRFDGINGQNSSYLSFLNDFSGPIKPTMFHCGWPFKLKS